MAPVKAAARNRGPARAATLRPSCPCARPRPSARPATSGSAGRRPSSARGAPRRRHVVGEQPGDEEDLAGRPFVGPAGALLDKALDEAGIERSRTYVTNVVKHFKWEPRGKRRIHAKPDALEIFACLPWLEAELAVVRAQLVVCLGATAAQAFLGKKFKVTQERERSWRPAGARVLATVHPSSILRAPDDETRRVEMRRFIDDLRKVAAAMAAAV
jgi:DNA polymerase